MIWVRTNKFDQRARLIADRHYNRQKVGSPQFAPPGKTVILYAENEGKKALWVSSWQEYIMHAWKNSWNCSLFRNEGAGLSSDLIRQAVAATLFEWGTPPSGGMITFVDPRKVKPKRTPGYCYIRAGFRPCGKTKVNQLLVFQLLPSKMPKPQMPLSRQLSLF